MAFLVILEQQQLVPMMILVDVYVYINELRNRFEVNNVTNNKTYRHLNPITKATMITIIVTHTHGMAIIKTLRETNVTNY